MVKFWSQRYKKWKPYNQLMFWLAIVSILIGLFFGGKYIIQISSNNNQIIIENSSLSNSPIFQDSSNISVTYGTETDSDVLNPLFYTHTFSVLRNLEHFGKRFDLYLMKIILPDGQEALLNKARFNETYTIAACNEEWTDCYVYHKYKTESKLTDEDVCAILYSRIGNEELGSDITSYTKKFQTEQKNCYEIIP